MFLLTFKRPLFLATAVLLLFYFLALSSMAQDAPTFDEQGFLVRGVGYLRGENRHMRVGHPLGLNALNASFLAFDEMVKLPTDDPSWQGTGFHRPAELFLWEIGNNVEHIMFLGRLPTIWLGMVLVVVIGRWAGELTGNRWAGLLALSLAAFDPNLLAHTRLATTDLGLAAGATIASFTLWRFFKRPSWSSAALAGVGLGLLQNTKFTAGLFVPLFALVILIYFGFTIYDLRLRSSPLALRSSPLALRSSPLALRSSPLALRSSPLVMLVLAYPLAAFFTLWACYGFQIGTLPENLPTLSWLSGWTLPLAHHIEQLLDIGGRLQIGTPSFLMGQYSDSGWWYYFPVAFLLKTPLPTLVLLVYSIFHVRIYDLRFTIYDWAALLIPSFGYFIIALTSDINLGYRHLLPVLPFLFVFIAASLHPSPLTLHPSLFSLPSLLVVALLGSTLWIYPHFLSYFNLLAGGPDGGWRYLVDSNIDWGQDLNKLKPWMDENGIEQVWLSYFGEARPNYYGIPYIGLDSFPPRLMNPQARPFYPHDPAPGIYVISVSNLQGVLFPNHDEFAWFREQEPMAKVGYSIFIYDVPTYGTPVTLGLSGIQLDEIDSADFAHLGTNEVSPSWFDASQAFIVPPGDQMWLGMESQTAVHPFLARLWWGRDTQQVENGRYSLRKLNITNLLTPWPLSHGPLAQFNQNTGQIELWEWSVTAESHPGDVLEIQTLWQQTAEPQPVKMFLHLLDENGQIMAQWDGLGAAWEGWRTNHYLIQIHQLAIPATAVPGTYQLWVGLYHPETLQRWQTDMDEDRFLLGIVEIGE